MAALATEFVGEDVDTKSSVFLDSYQPLQPLKKIESLLMAASTFTNKIGIAGITEMPLYTYSVSSLRRIYFQQFF